MASVRAHRTRSAPRFSLLGLTAVRSNWTTSNLTLQLYHAPSGRMAWQSVGDCTEYTEAITTAPVPLHVVMAELAGVMVSDLLQSRSRTSLLWITNQKARAEPERAHGASEAHPLPDDPSDADEPCPANQPDVEREQGAAVPGR